MEARVCFPIPEQLGGWDDWVEDSHSKTRLSGDTDVNFPKSDLVQAKAVQDPEPTRWEPPISSLESDTKDEFPESLPYSSYYDEVSGEWSINQTHTDSNDLLSLKEAAVKVLQRVSTPIRQAVEVVSSEAANTFERCSGHRSRHDLESKLQGLKKKIADLDKKLKEYKEEEEKIADLEIEPEENKFQELKETIEHLEEELKVEQRLQYEHLQQCTENIRNEQSRMRDLQNDLAASSASQNSLSASLAFEIYHLKESLKNLVQKYQDWQEPDEKYQDSQEPDEEEPGIALEDQLRITEQSKKAIDLLSSHLLSTVWQPCSKNSFGKCIMHCLKFSSIYIVDQLLAGFYIRIMLLSGSQFKRQLIPETAPLIILGFLTAFFSAAMQIILAYYLWTRLPETYPEVNGDNVSSHVYPGTSGGRRYFDWYAPSLPAYPYPNYKFANDVCRTVPIVQLVTIGLFLFSILNNIPGVIKNFHIIWNSDRFISVDEEGVTKLHYWRESQYLRKSADNFLKFLHTEFQANLQRNWIDRKIKEELSAVHNSIESVTRNTGNLKDFCRLWAKEQVLKPPPVPDAASTDSAEKILGVGEYELKAFICEMYLSGSIIHGTENQNKIREFQNKEAKKDQETHPEGGKQEVKSTDPVKDNKEYRSYAGASRRRWMLPKCYTEILPKNSWQSWMPYCCPKATGADIPIPKSFFEVCEMRCFLAEALRLMDQVPNTKKVGMARDYAPKQEPMLFHILRDNTTVWPPPFELKLWPQPIQFCDQVRLNLVRIDYLKPNKWIRPYAWSWSSKLEKKDDDSELKKLIEYLSVMIKARTELKNLKDKLMQNPTDENVMLDDIFLPLDQEFETNKHVLLKALYSLISEKKMKEDNLEKQRINCLCSLNKSPTFQFCISNIYKFISAAQKCCAFWCCPTTSNEKAGTKLLDALREFLGRDFADVLASVSFSYHCPSRMILCRSLAFAFGVLPEIVALLFMAVAGVQYILWSGFKVTSDTQGMEEIILATLAINFIYEIDDAVYDHVLPELYKEAHERDRFDITGYWISAETSAILNKCAGTASTRWWHAVRKLCCYRSPKRTHVENVVKEDVECFKMLAKCGPIVCQTDSRNPLARGFLEKTFREADDNAQLETNTKENSATSPAPAVEVDLDAEETLLLEDLNMIFKQEKSSDLSKHKETQNDLMNKFISKRLEVEGITLGKFDYWKRLFDKTIKAEKNLLWNDWDDGDLDGEKLRSPFVRAMKMSMSAEWNDIYLAHAYPFIYARKMHYTFANHAWERFLVFYGMWGMHLVALMCITLAIVGGYRSFARCDRFAPAGSEWLRVFAKQDWPKTCLLNLGHQQYESFAELENATASDFLAVSCGVTGYIPDKAEWASNRNYFGQPPLDD